MAEDKKGMCCKDWCNYLKAVVACIWAFGKTKPKTLTVLAFLGFTAYQYFIDPTIYGEFSIFYNGLDDLGQLQFWMIVTVIIGFIVNYYTTRKNDKEKLRLEIKTKQAESIVVYAGRMGQCCTEISLFSQNVLNFKNRLVEGLDPDAFAYWANIFRKQYIEFMNKHNGYRPLANEYFSFTHIHNLNYVTCKKTKEIYVISSLFDEALSSALRFETHFDIVNNDDNLRMYIDFHSTEDLEEVNRIAKQNSLKITTVASAIASALTKELHECTVEVLKATVKNPQFFKDQAEIVQGDKMIDFNALGKYFDDL